MGEVDDPWGQRKPQVRDPGNRTSDLAISRTGFPPDLAQPFRSETRESRLSRQKGWVLQFSVAAPGIQPGGGRTRSRDPCATAATKSPTTRWLPTAAGQSCPEACRQQPFASPRPWSARNQSRPGGEPTTLSIGKPTPVPASRGINPWVRGLAPRLETRPALRSGVCAASRSSPPSKASPGEVGGGIGSWLAVADGGCATALQADVVRPAIRWEWCGPLRAGLLPVGVPAPGWLSTASGQPSPRSPSRSGSGDRSSPRRPPLSRVHPEIGNVRRNHPQLPSASPGRVSTEFVAPPEVVIFAVALAVENAVLPRFSAAERASASA